MKNKKNFKFSRQYTIFIDSGTNFRHRQERNGERSFNEHERDDTSACNHSLHRLVIVYAEFSLRSCFRCNTQVSKIANFTRNFLQNYNDLEHAVKTKNAPFFMYF